MYSFDEENREFLRVDHESNVNFRELKPDKLANKNEVLTQNISACGLLFRTKQIPPALSKIIWVELDPKMVNVCSEIEEDLLIKDGGILGRVVRIAEGEPEVSYDVGVCFLRRKDLKDEEIEHFLSN